MNRNQNKEMLNTCVKLFVFTRDYDKFKRLEKAFCWLTKFFYLVAINIVSLTGRIEG